MSEEEDLDFVPLEERLPGDLEAWEAAALQFAVGVHDALVCEDVTAREAFSVLCGNRYCGACECKDGVPAGAEYVVCMSEEEADRWCVPMAAPGVTPLLGFQLRRHYSGSLRDVERLAFSFTADEIQMDFASRFQQLTSVDFSGVRGVIDISDRFLSECTGLLAFDFGPFTNLRGIGHQCLRGNSALSSVDLRGLKNLRGVGSNFLAGCRLIQSLDLRPLRSLKSIGNRFLVYTGVTSLDLEPLQAIKHIPDRFLASSEHLEFLNFSPLKNAESIGSFVLSGCASLHNVSLCGLGKVTTVDSGFMAWCIRLQSLDLSPLRNVETIGRHALLHCGKLGDVDFSHLRNVHRIDLERFLEGCGSLSDESRASAEAFKEEYRRRGADRSRGR